MPSFHAGQKLPSSVQMFKRKPQLMTAARVEIHGDHLLFLRSDGTLAALFVLEIVEGWPEVDFSGP
jgi:hypothetical protein